MIPFADCRCPVEECEANRGEDGCRCWFLRAEEPCDHPLWKRIWRRLTEWDGRGQEQQMGLEL